MNSKSTLLICSILFSLNSLAATNTSDPVADAKKLCHYQAVEKSGYDPQKPASKNTVAKGAGAGAAGGTAVRAIQGKSLLKGAVIGAGVGAAGGGLKKNQDKKKAVLGESNYKTEYDSCLRSRGLNPENIK